MVSPSKVDAWRLHRGLIAPSIGAAGPAVIPTGRGVPSGMLARRHPPGLAALLVVACTPAPATTTPTTRAPPVVAAPAAPAEAKPADTAIAEKPNAYPLPPPLPEPPVTLATIRCCV